MVRITSLKVEKDLDISWECEFDCILDYVYKDLLISVPVSKQLLRHVTRLQDTDFQILLLNLNLEQISYISGDVRRLLHMLFELKASWLEHLNVDLTLNEEVHDLGRVIDDFEVLEPLRNQRNIPVLFYILVVNDSREINDGV